MPSAGKSSPDDQSAPTVRPMFACNEHRQPNQPSHTSSCPSLSGEEDSLLSRSVTTVTSSLLPVSLGLTSPMLVAACSAITASSVKDGDCPKSILVINDVKIA
eukprot:756055-Hanusia_phi.AAC.5